MLEYLSDLSDFISVSNDISVYIDFSRSSIFGSFSSSSFFSVLESFSIVCPLYLIGYFQIEFNAKPSVGISYFYDFKIHVAEPFI
jgi:hypothetical protein